MGHDKPAMTKPVTKVPAGGEVMPTHELVLWPEVQNAAALEAWSKQFGKEIDLAKLVEGLRSKAKTVSGGDMRPLEEMLYGQATTLQGMFTNLSRRAANQEYLKQFQAYMTLALKAQAQCRATLQALAEIKNPRPVQFVGQANIAQGPQQVNNGPAPAPPRAPADKDANAQSKLLDAANEQRMDTRTSVTTGGADPVLETVGASDRPAD